jgi:hypothetical protein
VVDVVDVVDARVVEAEAAADDDVPPEVEAVLVEVEVEALWAASSLASVAWAEASVASADVTSAWSWVTSRDARVCPAETCWPTVTSTVLTVPDVLKLREAWLTGVIVATESRVCTAVPVPTVVVR